MKKIVWIWAVALLTACGGRQQGAKPEAAWQREAKFNAFLQLSTAVSLDSSQKVLDTLLAHYAADSAAMKQLVDKLAQPLADPNSPIRNEELYILILEAVIASPFYDSVEKIKPRFRLEMALKNRVGRPANDFEYTLGDGARGRLYGVEAPYTLLYINNPDCHACEEMLAQLVGSKVIAEAQREGRLKIVAIYPDEDLAAWRKHRKEVPAEWINGYDAGLAMRREELYDLRAIPSLYLLDGEKRVLLKDCTVVGQIEAYLTRQ